MNPLPPTPTPERQNTPDSPEAWARLFHTIYERLAPSFGYETRTDTRDFDPESKNGGLMIAVCGEVVSTLITQNAALAQRLEEVEKIERCEECNAELSACGPLDDDGIPTMDCRACELASRIDALQDQLAAAEKERRKVMDALIEASNESGIDAPCHEDDLLMAVESFFGRARKLWEDQLAAAVADSRRLAVAAKAHIQARYNFEAVRADYSINPTEELGHATSQASCAWSDTEEQLEILITTAMSAQH